MSENDQPAVETATIENRSGGVNVDAQQVNIGGDVVGRDKIVQNITYEASTPIATSLHQLPPPPRDFTGREAELAELMAKAETDGVTISGLQGMGGIGKTALALVLAEKLRPRYPDAQFYLDLKGADKQPLSVTTALTHVIRSYHPTAKLPEGEAELRGLYLSALEDQRALLFMDNAADSAQVEPLIPPSSCFLLVTSRQHFALPGLFSKDLNTLPPDDARDLLLKIAPRVHDQADVIAKLCGYLPLALRLAGSALAEWRTLTPIEYVKRLEDVQPRLELVEASLSLSYALLSKELQRAWCALAVFPGTFDLAAVMAVWQVDMKVAQDRLDRLVRYSLVEWNEFAQRAHLHDLARLFGDKCLSISIVDWLGSQRQYAEHYQRVSATANKMYEQGGERLIQGLALFDREWAHIQTGQAWAAQLNGWDMKARQLCIKYPAECSSIMILRLHPRQQVLWLESAQSAMGILSRILLGGPYLCNLGVAYYQLGEYHRAIKCFKQALTIEHRIRGKRNDSLIFANLGAAYSCLGEYRRAIEYDEQALVISHKRHDLQVESLILNNLSAVYHDLGAYHRAIEICEQSLVIAREIGNRRGEGAALDSLGLAYRSLGEYHRAIEYCTQSLTIFREIGDRRGEGDALGNLGLAYQSLGEYHRAIEYCTQSLTIVREIGDRRGEGEALVTLGDAYNDLGEYRRASEYGEQALTIAREIGNRRGESEALSNLGHAYYSLGEYRRAIGYYEQALIIAREIGNRLGEANAMRGLALCSNAVNDRPQAIAHAQAAMDIFTAIESPHAQEVRDLLAKWRE